MISKMMMKDINQQWSVEKVKGTKYGDNIYKIINLSRNKALAIEDDEELDDSIFKKDDEEEKIDKKEKPKRKKLFGRRK